MKVTGIIAVAVLTLIGCGGGGSSSPDVAVNAANTRIQSINFNYYRDGTTMSSPVSFIYAKDFDGDGIDEIFFAAFETGPNTPANYSNTSVHILGWEAGVFKELTSRWLPGTSNEVEGVGDVCFGDFNGDGRVDVFLSAYTDMNHPVHPYALINQGGTFTKVQLPVQTWQHGVTCVDANKDGFDDVLVAAYSSSSPQYLGSATGLIEYQGMAGSSGIAAGDFLGDGTVQAIVTDGATDGINDTKLYSLTINDISKTIGFSLTTILPSPRLDTIFADPTDYRSSHDIRARAVDFNNDGKLDVVVFSNRANNVDTYANVSEIQFLKNNGGGVFEDVTDSVRVGFDVSSMVGYFPEFRDFNYDGRVDLFTSIPYWGTNYKHASLLRQSSDGRFVNTASSELKSMINEGDGGGQAVLARGPSGVFYLIREHAWRADGITRVSAHEFSF